MTTLDMDKLFTIAGTSYYKGERTLRFASGKPQVRESVLRRNKHQDVVFYSLPKPMTRDEAYKWLVAKGVEGVLPDGHRKKEYSRYAAQLAAARAAAQAAEAEAAAAEAAAEELLASAEPSAEDKLAAKRERDAARKRAKRAADKAAKLEAQEAAGA